MSYKLKSDLSFIAESYAPHGGKAQKTTNGFKMRCPAHDGTKNSCSITLKDGKILTKCFSHDCSYEDIMDALCAKGFAEKTESKKEKSKRAKRIKETLWRIVDKNGKFISNHIRIDFDIKPKEFRWKPRLEAVGLTGVDQVPLYNIDKIKPGHTKIVLVEGEKACDALWSVGVPSVATVTGCKGQPCDKVLNDIQGHYVELWPDNDVDSVGAVHMKTIRRQLTDLEIENCTIIWKDAPLKGDAFDFIAAGNGKEQIEQLPRDRQKNDDDWEFLLRKKKSGENDNCDANVLLVLENHTDIKGKLGYDSRAHIPTVTKHIKHVTYRNREYPHKLEEYELTKLTKWFAHRMGMDVSYNRIASLIRPICLNPKVSNHYDPFQVYLDGIKWDGVERLEGALQKHAGVDDNSFIRAVFKCTMLSAVARTYKPGCKVDNMLILVGEQGVGKSSLFRALLPGSSYFVDHIPDLRNADARSQLHGVVFLEIAELEAFGNVAAAAIKSFLTAQVDKFRPSYGRTPVEFPRTCVFVGSTNSDTFTQDVTGGRRFWPVRVNGNINVKWFEKNRDQLWGEAVVRYKRGEKWWLTGELVEKQKEIIDEYRQDMAWEIHVIKYLKLGRLDLAFNLHKDYFDDDGNRVFVTSEEIYKHCLGIDVSRQDVKEQKQLAKVLRVLGCRKKRPTIDGARIHAYLLPVDFQEKYAGVEPDPKDDKNEPENDEPAKPEQKQGKQPKFEVIYNYSNY